MARSASDGDVGTGNDNGIKVIIKSIPESLFTVNTNLMICDRATLTVVPAKVTVAPVWRLCRSIVLDGGADKLESTMLVQDATAEERDAYSVTTQVVPPELAAAAMVGAGVAAGISSEEEVEPAGRVAFIKLVFEPVGK